VLSSPLRYRDSLSMRQHYAHFGRRPPIGLYVFIHPLPRVISWEQMAADDLGRMLGWEFSLMVATVRLINSGLLDELPSLRIHISHFAGGIGRYLPRIQGLQQREKSIHPPKTALPRFGAEISVWL
jgi:hypothetical protein